MTQALSSVLKKHFSQIKAMKAKTVKMKEQVCEKGFQLYGFYGNWRRECSHAFIRIMSENLGNLVRYECCMCHEVIDTDEGKPEYIDTFTVPLSLDWLSLSYYIDQKIKMCTPPECMAIIKSKEEEYKKIDEEWFRMKEELRELEEKIESMETQLEEYANSIYKFLGKPRVKYIHVPSSHYDFDDPEPYDT
ncbi:MAG: hypothetical protein IJ220_05935 [Clostridia bacterium]|nr:hypothetical protein [Clostridia bacterium]